MAETVVKRATPQRRDTYHSLSSRAGVLERGYKTEPEYSRGEPRGFNRLLHNVALSASADEDV